MSDEPPGWDELFGDAFPEDDERDEDATADARRAAEQHPAGRT